MRVRPNPRAKRARAGLLTIGYQAHSVESLIQSLIAHGVEILMDVRQNPVSRRPGFSKRWLEQAVVDAGIEYRHNPELGTPIRIRRMYHCPGDIPSALAAYERYISSNPEPLRLLAQVAGARMVCLLCLEKDHTMCHRGVIAQKFWEMTKCKPIHLT